MGLKVLGKEGIRNVEVVIKSDQNGIESCEPATCVQNRPDDKIRPKWD